MASVAEIIADGDLPRCYLVQLTPFDPVAQTGQDHYFSAFGFEGVFDGEFWDKRLVDVYQFTRSVLPVSKLSPKSSGGRISIANADGALDGLRDLVWTGCPVVIWLGDPAGSFSGFGRVHTGRVAQASFDAAEIRITLRDPREALNRPVQDTLFAGTGGGEGGADLKARAKPLAIGHIYNAPGTLIDASIWRFALSERGLAGVDGARDRGNALSYAGDFADLDDWTPIGGQYATNRGAGQAQAGGRPETLTFDFRGDDSGGFVDTVPDIIARLVAWKGGPDAPAINAASFAAANAARGWPGGLYLPDGGGSLIDVLDGLAASIGAFIDFNGDGELLLSLIGGGAPGESLTESDYLSLRSRQNEPPAKQTRIGWRKVALVQGPEELSLPGGIEGQGALATKDSVVYRSPSAPPSPIADEIWIDTDDGNRLYVYDAVSGWVDVRDAGIAQAISDAAGAQATADGKVATFIAASAPTADGVGDLWVDTSDNNNLYRWSGSAWVDVRDAGIPQALSDAANAQATADGKVTTFYTATTPTAEGVGDLWQNTSTYELRRWSGSVWDLVADITAQKTAAAVINQGALATKDVADWQGDVSGTGKPSDYADNSGDQIVTSADYNPQLDILDSDQLPAGFRAIGGASDRTNISTFSESGVVGVRITPTSTESGYGLPAFAVHKYDQIEVTYRLRRTNADNSAIVVRAKYGEGEMPSGKTHLGEFTGGESMVAPAGSDVTLSTHLPGTNFEKRTWQFTPPAAALWCTIGFYWQSFGAGGDYLDIDYIQIRAGSKGALSALDAADWATDISGTGKPDSYANLSYAETAIAETLTTQGLFDGTDYDVWHTLESVTFTVDAAQAPDNCEIIANADALVKEIISGGQAHSAIQPAGGPEITYRVRRGSTVLFTAQPVSVSGPGSAPILYLPVVDTSPPSSGSVTYDIQVKWSRGSYTDGTISWSDGNSYVTGTGTLFSGNVSNAWEIDVGGTWHQISVVNSNTSLNLSTAVSGNGTNQSYTARNNNHALKMDFLRAHLKVIQYGRSS